LTNTLNLNVVSFKTRSAVIVLTAQRCSCLRHTK